MSVAYTEGVWQVKPGHADEFVAAWSEFADWTSEHADGSGWVKLLRDREDANRFVTIGPWASLEAIEAWRSLDGWQERIGRVRRLLVDFRASTLEVVLERE